MQGKEQREKENPRGRKSAVERFTRGLNLGIIVDLKELRKKLEQTQGELRRAKKKGATPASLLIGIREKRERCRLPPKDRKR